MEIGQVAFVGALLLLLYAIKGGLAKGVDRQVHVLASRMRVTAAYLVGSVASYWLIARVFAVVDTDKGIDSRSVQDLASSAMPSR